jgi:hypothetical protein
MDYQIQETHISNAQEEVFFKKDAFVDLDSIYKSPEGKIGFFIVEKLPVHAVVGFPKMPIGLSFISILSLSCLN